MTVTSLAGHLVTTALSCLRPWHRVLPSSPSPSKQTEARLSTCRACCASLPLHRRYGHLIASVTVGKGGDAASKQNSDLSCQAPRPRLPTSPRRLSYDNTAHSTQTEDRGSVPSTRFITCSFTDRLCQDLMKSHDEGRAGGPGYLEVSLYCGRYGRGPLCLAVNSQFFHGTGRVHRVWPGQIMDHRRTPSMKHKDISHMSGSSAGHSIS